MIDLSAFLSHDAGPLAQFIKYVLVGGIATAVNILAFYIAGWLLFPCLTDNDVVVRLVKRLTRRTTKVEGRRSKDDDDATTQRCNDATNRSRARNAIFCNVIAFFFSNTTCYILNRLYVFRPGAMSVFWEAVSFFAVSAVSTFIGTACQTVLIRKAGMQTTFAFVANLVSALAINFVMRKYVVFNG
jgi:putative flippase GtrA